MLNIGMKIREHRKEQGLKVFELARQVGINAVYITQIEKHGKLPSPSVFKKICEVLHLPEEIYNDYLRKKYEDAYLDSTGNVRDIPLSKDVKSEHQNEIFGKDDDADEERVIPGRDADDLDDEIQKVMSNLSKLIDTGTANREEIREIILLSEKCKNLIIKKKQLKNEAESILNESREVLSKSKVSTPPLPK